MANEEVVKILAMEKSVYEDALCNAVFSGTSYSVSKVMAFMKVIDALDAAINIISEASAN